MPVRQSARYAAAWSLVVAGCLALAPPARADGPLDGTYTGDGVRVRGDDGTCGAETRKTTITVKDGQFQYTWNRQMNVVVTVTVKPDGTVTGEQRWGRSGSAVIVTGKVVGKTMDAMFDSQSCARRFTLTRG